MISFLIGVGVLALLMLSTAAGVIFASILERMRLKYIGNSAKVFTPQEFDVY